MSVGTILLILAGLLILFGVGQRVLDRLRLTDRQALLFIALIVLGGLAPDVHISDAFAINLGGAVIPLALCVYLFIKADSFSEKVRSVISPMLTAIAVYLLGRLLPDDPAEMAIDPHYIYGIAAGAIAYVLGRSRRCAFISGVVGVTLAQLASWIYVRSNGVNQRLVLGGAGAYDVVVLSGLIAVLLAELVGEALERASRGRRRPVREFRGGDFVRKEHE